MATENTAPATAPKAKTKIAAPKKAPRSKGKAKDGAATKRRERKPAEPKAKEPTKKEQIVAMLRSPEGTTLDAIVARFGVQRHSARASVSVFGREIGGVSYDKATRVYRATAA